MKIQSSEFQILNNSLKVSVLMCFSVTYNTLITMFGNHREPESALNLFYELKQQFAPDTATYNTLITMYGNLKQPENALKIFEEMQVCSDFNNFVTPETETLPKPYKTPKTETLKFLILTFSGND